MPMRTLMKIEGRTGFNERVGFDTPPSRCPSARRSSLDVLRLPLDLKSEAYSTVLTKQLPRALHDATHVMQL